MQLLALGAAIKDSERNKFSVVVSPDEAGITFGIVDATKPREEWTGTAQAAIKVSSNAVRLVSVKFPSTSSLCVCSLFLQLRFCN